MHSLLAEARAAQRGLRGEGCGVEVRARPRAAAVSGTQADAVAFGSLVRELGTPLLDWRAAISGPDDPTERWRAALAADANAKLPIRLTDQSGPASPGSRFGQR